MLIFIAALLLLFSYDLTKLRNQNNTMIKQNEKVISLLEEIKNK